MRVLLSIAFTAVAFWHCPQCSAMENVIKTYFAAKESASTIRNKMDILVGMSTFAAMVDPLEGDALGERKRMVDFYLAPWAAHPFTMAMFAGMRQACNQVMDLADLVLSDEENPPFDISLSHVQIFSNYLTQFDAMLNLPVWSTRSLRTRLLPYLLVNCHPVVPNLIEWEKKAHREIRKKKHQGETCGTTLNRPLALQAFETLIKLLGEHPLKKYDPVFSKKYCAVGTTVQNEMFYLAGPQLFVHLTMPLENMKKYMDKHLGSESKPKKASYSLKNGMMTNPTFMPRRRRHVQTQLDDLVRRLGQKTAKWDSIFAQIKTDLGETMEMAEEIGCEFVFSEKCPNSLFKRTRRMPSDMEFPCAGILSPYLCCGARSIRRKTKQINSKSQGAAGNVVEGCRERGLSKSNYLDEDEDDADEDADEDSDDEQDEQDEEPTE